MSNKTKLTDETLGNNTITGPNLAPANLTDADISPNVGLNITTPNLASSLDLSSKSLTLPSSSLSPFAANAGTQAFNIGILGFKQAVNNGLTVFNLVDGIVDEFHDESGVDTPENANANYDATNDLYSNPTTTMTVISETFTAQTAPTTARIVIFAELLDGTGDFVVSATRDNSTFNTITLTDEGFQAGSSGLKIFSGSTTLTGTSSPQVALRWKVVGSSLTGTNKMHGVALQWA